METQWPLIIFTLFVCLSCGTLAGMSALVIQGKGEKLRFPALILSAVALVIGGIGSFLHLEHWERIFNGFGHITSGITQELIGVVVLAVLMVVWFVVLRGKSGASKALAWVTIILAVAMVIATSHSYMMAARPAWGFGLYIFYLANAFVLGAIAMWALAIYAKDESVEGWAINLSFISSIVQFVANVVFVGLCATTAITDFGFYADPTKMTTAPTHVASLMDVAITGAGAVYFWISLVLMIVAIICAFMAKKKVGSSNAYMIVTVLSVFVSSILFRVLFYVLGYSVFLLY